MFNNQLLLLGSEGGVFEDDAPAVLPPTLDTPESARLSREAAPETGSADGRTEGPAAQKRTENRRTLESQRSGNASGNASNRSPRRLLALASFWIPRAHREAARGDLLEDLAEMKESGLARGWIFLVIAWQLTLLLVAVVRSAFKGAIADLLTPKST